MCDPWWMFKKGLSVNQKDYLCWKHIDKNLRYNWGEHIKNIENAKKYQRNFEKWHLGDLEKICLDNDIKRWEHLIDLGLDGISADKLNDEYFKSYPKKKRR